ncbi:putative translation initiation factor 1A-3 (aIF-1A-3) [Desulforapulum autotrophicum HRM2]|uniref:Translation initiation factor 1A-3 (AIF-1A-3) n=1 Tax=Desulforapulum autotrophicum (strain ATCC 43914 / DSM 3382 / VKM B-1955 / HRM2) TaxID=177437 RepID=C0QEP9_DESAH|nr:DUF2058 family protein [Desulforapulum autotrophicum]ACN15391.1 putative translation initiation factor 1A-3 (aIF-1A-3) [Desulforapulum autotrophicum HRM2]
MGNSLREQLLKAGLVDKKQVNKAKHDKRITSQKTKGQKTKGQKTRQAAPVEDSVTREERLAYEERNRELNRLRNEEKKRRETMAQIKQLIKTNRITLKERDDDAPFYFVVGKKVKKMFLSEKISNDLTHGRMAIANLDGRFEIIPESAARQIADRDRKPLVFFNDAPPQDPDPQSEPLDL